MGGEYDAILTGTGQLGPYPDHLLKRVDRPTAGILGPMERRSQTDNAVTHLLSGSMGPVLQKRAAQFNKFYPLGSYIGEVRSRISCTPRNEASLVKLPAPDGVDPHILTRHLKALAYFLGADAVGVCTVPESAKYLDTPAGEPLPPLLPTGMVFLRRNDPLTSMASDGADWIVDATAQRCYAHLAMISEIMTSYILGMGYRAEVNNLRHFTTLIPPLIIHAGLGEASRIGIALNPFFGADFKAVALLPDMPLETDRPIDFGLQEYCSRCTICAEVCPGRALSFGGKEIYNGYEKWPVEPDLCFASLLCNDKASNCCKCIFACPWTRPGTSPDDWAKWDGSTESLIAAADARAEELRKNGYRRNDAPGSRWWFDK